MKVPVSLICRIAVEESIIIAISESISIPIAAVKSQIAALIQIAAVASRENWLPSVIYYA
jgi:hypothetical protein